MKSKVRIPVLPTACVYHDREKYTIEVELAGVDKKNIDFEMSETSFCLTAPRNDVEYFGCWVLAHNVDPKKAKGTFKNGLLTVTAPLAKPLKGVKVSIE
ncbi:MAG: Hsp20/alpha crystallin family protein [Candidatus Bathyarchaeota archaeon]|nr:Hsp20/alpha crystallin family protein [Candidatus Bathyarchaeota archaeon]